MSHGSGIDVRIASIPHLIRMKEAAGRTQDLADFARRTREKRLAWPQSALQLAYQSGAIKPRLPEASESSAAQPAHPAR